MGIKSLTTSFMKAARNFLGMKEKVVIPLSRIERLLELDSPKYMKLDKIGRGIDSYGLSRCAYTDPEQMLAHENELVRSSASIMMDDFPLRFGRWAFVVAVRSEIRGEDDIEDPFSTMVFALYCVRNQKGDLKIENILVPEIDQYRCMSGLRQADVTDPAEVERAFAYVELCKNQIFSGGPLRARDNWREVTERKIPPAPTPHIS